MDQLNLLSVAETAQRLDRSTEQVRRYLREKRLRGHRIGGQWFIEAKALTEFLDHAVTERGFMARLRASHEPDPLGATIGMTTGGGSNIAAGKAVYRRADGRRR
ncbi:MAG: helix-turn-helix domain-containing protein [Chloroflexota bacterium]|nr:helix-turn-helix domain-containing protein [Chloroflexota bacterium]